MYKHECMNAAVHSSAKAEQAYVITTRTIEHTLDNSTRMLFAGGHEETTGLPERLEGWPGGCG